MIPTSVFHGGDRCNLSAAEDHSLIRHTNEDMLSKRNKKNN